jgi:hypothetical protein
MLGARAAGVTVTHEPFKLRDPGSIPGRPTYSSDSRAAHLQLRFPGGPLGGGELKPFSPEGWEEMALVRAVAAEAGRGPARIAYTTATASISTSIRGSIRALTSTIVITGRVSPNASAWARPTSPVRAMSTT